MNTQSSIIASHKALSFHVGFVPNSIAKEHAFSGSNKTRIGLAWSLHVWQSEVISSLKFIVSCMIF